MIQGAQYFLTLLIMSNTTKPIAYSAYIVCGPEDNSQWIRAGAVFAAKEGRYVVKIDALPLDGKLVLCPPKPKDDAPAEA